MRCRRNASPFLIWIKLDFLFWQWWSLGHWNTCWCVSSVICCVKMNISALVTPTVSNRLRYFMKIFFQLGRNSVKNFNLLRFVTACIERNYGFTFFYITARPLLSVLWTAFSITFRFTISQPVKYFFNFRIFGFTSSWKFFADVVFTISRSYRFCCNLIECQSRM